MKVVFIPKQGKDDYSSAKSFRPITLSNFMLKGLERVVQWQVQEATLHGRPLYNQHAYTCNYSTETALSDAVNFVEKGIYQNNDVLMVSLDCTGAFDYIKFASARQSMADIGIEPYINEWYQHLLKGRRVTANILGIEDHTIPRRGSPQGGVLSPLVWNVIMNTLLTQFKGGPIYAVGYADDVLLMISGKSISTMTNMMQCALKKVTEWREANGLTFNPSKTNAMLCTTGYKRTTFPLKMSGTEIPYVKELRYLGLLIDHRLTWSTHISERLKKCSKVWNLTRCLVGQKWGLNPEKLLWIYTAIVRPTLSYGSIVWSHKINDTLAKKLERLQRKILLAMSMTLRGDHSRLNATEPLPR